jgi:hypothetical protein
MVGAEVTKRVLTALAEAHPAGGECAVSGFDIERGWGGVVHVRIYAASQDQGANGDHWRELRSAVEGALEAERHNVRIEQRS